MRVLRRVSSWVAVPALSGGALISGGGAAVAQPSTHGLAIQAPGDGGWSPSARPGDSTFSWSPAKAKPTTHAPVYDPHAKVVRELTNRRTANADFHQFGRADSGEALGRSGQLPGCARGVAADQHGRGSGTGA